MHEQSLARHIMDIVEQLMRQNSWQTVTRITVCLQLPSLVMPELLIEGFDLLKRDSLFPRAQLAIEKIPMVFCCKDCSGEFAGEKMALSCPRCGSTSLRLARKSEIYISSIDYDER
ncbi:MAG: hydrogenase maturation nickel metallochaperone HypA [Bacillota bacterium]